MTYFPNGFPPNRHLPPPRLTRSAGPRHGCGWYLGAFLCGFCVLILVLYVSLVHSLHNLNQGPTVSAAFGPAETRQVVTLDKHAAATDPATLAQLTQGDGWLVPGPTALLDSCWISPADSSRTSQNPLACARTTTQYFGFSGDFAQQVTAWSAQLTAAGWNTNPGLAAVLNGYQNLLQYRTEQPVPSQSQNPSSASASTSTSAPNPADLPIVELPALTGCRTVASAHSVGNCNQRITINWAVSGSGVVQAHPAAQIPADSQQYIRTSTTVNGITAETILLASNGYAAVVTYTDTYDDTYYAAAPAAAG